MITRAASSLTLDGVREGEGRRAWTVVSAMEEG